LPPPSYLSCVRPQDSEIPPSYMRVRFAIDCDDVI
jgi:hypothetical protein